MHQEGGRRGRTMKMSFLKRVEERVREKREKREKRMIERMIGR